MSRITIIRDDGFVSIDGRGFRGLDMSGIDPKIHAVQWFDVIGEMELAPDEQGRPANIDITDMTFAQPAIDAWKAAADAEDAPPPPLSLEDYAKEKRNDLESSCREHITGGVASNALGNGHIYPTQNTADHPDQHNLNRLVTSSLLNDAEATWECHLWCADESGVWDRRAHNHEQIRAVNKAVEAHVVNAQNKLKSLNDQLQTIVTDTVMSDDDKRTAIDAVVW